MNFSGNKISVRSADKGIFRLIAKWLVICLFIFNASLADFLTYDSFSLPGDIPADTSEGLLSGSKDIDVSSFYLPADLGSIKSFYDAGEESRLIVHIQDAHCNYPAQRKIARIIEYLNTVYGIKVVNLEGGSGGYDTSVFTSIVDKNVREKVADHFVKSGELNGAEFFAVNNDEKIELWGIEDPGLYLRNFDVFKKAYPERHAALEDLDRLKDEINKLKARVYSPALHELDRDQALYREEKIPLKDYVGTLIKKGVERGVDLSAYPNIMLLNNIISVESEIDFKQANRERDSLVEELRKSFSKRETRELAYYTRLSRANEITKDDFYQYIFDKASYADIDIAEYPALVKYREYIGMYHSIDKFLVVNELAELDSALKYGMCENEEQRELIYLSKNIYILINMFDFKLTREEYSYYKKNRSSFDARDFTVFIKKNDATFEPSEKVYELDGMRTGLEDFFDLSLERDNAFTRNMKYSGQEPRSGRRRTGAAALVTGGFHTENLCELFRKQGVSYISIMPAFTNEKGYASPYFRLLSGGEDEISEFIKTSESSLQIYSLLNELGVMAGGEERVKRFQKAVEIYEHISTKPEPYFLRHDLKTFAFSMRRDGTVACERVVTFSTKAGIDMGGKKSPLFTATKKITPGIGIGDNTNVSVKVKTASAANEKPYVLPRLPVSKQTVSGDSVKDPRSLKLKRINEIFIVDGVVDAFLPEKTLEAIIPASFTLSKSAAEKQSTLPVQKLNRQDVQRGIREHARLIEANFRALEIMGNNVNRLDKKVVEAMVEQVNKMFTAYKDIVLLSKDVKMRHNMLTAQMKWREFNIRLRALLKKDVITREEYVDNITELNQINGKTENIKTLHDFINFVHQASFDPVFEIAKKGDAEEVLNISNEKNGKKASQIKLIDIGETPAIQNGRITSGTLAALINNAEAFAETETSGTFIFDDNKFFAHIPLGAHTAAIHVNLDAPEDGGVLNVRFQESMANADNHIRLKYLKNVFESFGMVTDQPEGSLFISARLDKDTGLRNMHQITEMLSKVINLVFYTTHMNLAFSRELKENPDLSYDEIAKSATQSFLDNQKIHMTPEYRFYSVMLPDEMKKSINFRLEELGLLPIPSELALTQAVIDRYVNSPIEQKFERGMIKLENGRLSRNDANFNPFQDFINNLPRTPASPTDVEMKNAALLYKTGEAIGSIQGAMLFDAIGIIGGTLVQSGVIKSPEGETFIAAVMRDSEGRILFGKISVKTDDGRFIDISLDDFLEKMGHLSYKLRLEDPRDTELLNGLAFLDKKWDTGMAAREITTLKGEKISSGKSLFWKATFQKKTHFPEKRVLLTTHTTPEDTAYLDEYAAIAPNGGSANAHAGIVTREKGIPAVIVRGAVEIRKNGKPAWEITSYEADEAKMIDIGKGFTAYAGVIAKTIVIEEGDWVSVDGDNGILYVKKQSPENGGLPPDKDERGMDEKAKETMEKPGKEAADNFTTIDYARGNMDPVAHLDDINKIITEKGAGIEKELTGNIGGKAFNLARILSYSGKMDFKTAGGVVLTVRAFNDFISDCDLADTILKVLRYGSGEMSWEEKTEAIKNIFTGKTISGEDLDDARKRKYVAAKAKLEAEINKVFALKNNKGLDNTKLYAVRSSNISEDSAAAAFAGAGDTFLSIPAEQVTDNVIKNFASFATTRALKYRLSNNMLDFEIGHAVVVQEMVDVENIDTDCAGIIFSRNAADAENRDNVIINPGYGLGEGIVSGGNADRHELDRAGKLIRYNGAYKLLSVVKDEKGGTAEKLIAGKNYLETQVLRRRKILTHAQEKKLTDIAVKMEWVYGSPVDIEFAIKDGEIYILQVRPITTLEGSIPMAWEKMLGQKGLDITDAGFLEKVGSLYQAIDEDKLKLYKDLAGEKIRTEFFDRIKG
ncbi:MAG: PEP/pyruvate-binding domain-containing protein, partial [Candidatus Omnitrophota bacterium]